MPNRIPVRVLTEIDGVVYDSKHATVIHYWDETYLLKPYRNVLGKNTEGCLFLSTISEGTILFPEPRIRVFPCGRTIAIMLLVDAGAPNPVLEGLEVEIITPAISDVPHHRPAMKTVLASDIRFGCETLKKSDDGRFWMVRRRGIFGWERVRTRQVSQRQAIGWAIRNGVSLFSDQLQMLGIRNTLE